MRSVLIVGGGAAGLCAATLLNRHGVDAEIVEINTELRPLGSGLTMLGPTLRALRMVDESALERCVQHGAGHHVLAFGNADGEILERLTLPQPAGPDYPGGFGIMRPVFWGLLADIAKEAGARIRLATTVAAIDQDGDGVEVELTDRTRRTWDLVVGADGLHSRVRELAFPDAPEPFFTGQTVWRAVVPRPADLSSDMGMYYGPRNKAGANPVSADEMYVFVVENSLQLAEWEKRPDDPDADPASLSGASWGALAAPS